MPNKTVTADSYLEKLHKDILTIMDEIHRLCEKNNLRYYLCGGSLLGAIRHNGFIPWDDDLDIMMPRKDFEALMALCKTELSDKFYLDWYTTNKNYWQTFAKICLKGTLVQENLSDNPKYDTNWGIYVDIFPLDYTNGNLRKIEFRRRIISFCTASIYEKLYKDSNDFKVKIGAFLFPRNFLLRLEKLASTFRKKENSHLTRFNVQYEIRRSVYLSDSFEPAQLHEFDGHKFYVPYDSNYNLKTLFGDKYMQIPPINKRRTHNPCLIKFSDGTIVYLGKKQKVVSVEDSINY